MKKGAIFWHKNIIYQYYSNKAQAINVITEIRIKCLLDKKFKKYSDLKNVSYFEELKKKKEHTFN